MVVEWLTVDRARAHMLARVSLAVCMGVLLLLDRMAVGCCEDGAVMWMMVRDLMVVVVVSIWYLVAYVGRYRCDGCIDDTWHCQVAWRATATDIAATTTGTAVDTAAATVIAAAASAAATYRALMISA